VADIGSDDVILSLSWCQATDIGLIVTNPTPDWAEYETGVRQLVRIDNGMRWALADAYRIGDNFTSKDGTQAIDFAGVSLKTLQNYAWIAGRYSYGERVRGVSIHHHGVVAKLKPERRAYWLIRTLKDDLTVEQLEEYTAQERGVEGGYRSPYDTLVDQYNRMLEAYKLLPHTPETQQVQHALSVLESALKALRRALERIRRAA
jgi:hypothetical protein